MKETNLRKIQKLDEAGKANVEGGETEDLPGNETRDIGRERDEIEDGIIGEVKAEKENEEPASNVATWVVLHRFWVCWRASEVIGFVPVGV